MTGDRLIETQADSRTRTEIHMGPWLEDYAAGTLRSACERQLEAHVLVCDNCFAALVALYLRRS